MFSIIINSPAQLQHRKAAPYYRIRVKHLRAFGDRTIAIKQSHLRMSVFTSRSEQCLLVLAVAYAIADVQGSEGMAYNLGLAIFGLLSSQSKSSQSLLWTFWGLPLAILFDIIFLASGVGGAAVIGVKIVGAIMILAKLACAYTLYYALAHDHAVSVFRPGTAAPSPNAYTDPTTAAEGLHQVTSDEEIQAPKVPTSPYQSYQS